MGFEPDQHSTGLGLRLLRYRAEVMEAMLQIDSAPGQGTTIQCALHNTK
jgi:signal transduction histidine kinase